ncbi:MAG: dTMP kinase [Phascolarctobacterium sp.]|nr:MAG: dTMP kinase [Phascolarctobacterium sp.]
MSKGYFISLEGPDGCGKTTQLEHIAARLRSLGRDVVTTREPGGTRLAEQLRGFVLDPELIMNARTETLLYIAARADHAERIIKPALLAGKIVLCDRFSDSTEVYQGIVRGLPLAAVHALSEFATDGLEPDLTILLDGDPDLLAARRELRGVHDRYENAGLDFQRKIRDGFMLLAEKYPQRIHKINALQDEQKVTADIMRVINTFIKI